MTSSMQYASVDLIPSSWHRFEQWRRHLTILALTALVVLGGGTAAGLYLGHRAAIVDRELAVVDSLTAKLHRLRTDNAVIEARIDAVADAQARLDGYAQTGAWRRMLERLATQVPDTIVLTALSTSRPGASTTPSRAKSSADAKRANDANNANDAEEEPPPVAGLLNIEGLAADPIALNGFVDAIEADRMFRKVTLVRTKRQTLGGLEGLSFSIVCAW